MSPLSTIEVNILLDVESPLGKRVFFKSIILVNMISNSSLGKKSYPCFLLGNAEKFQLTLHICENVFGLLMGIKLSKS